MCLHEKDLQFQKKKIIIMFPLFMLYTRRQSSRPFLSGLKHDYRDEE